MLDVCPEEFAENCMNQSVKCFKCKALHEEGEAFYYVPLITIEGLEKKAHPYTTQRKKQEQQAHRETKYNRKLNNKASAQGRKSERNTIKDLQKKVGTDVIKRTALSGAKFGDGDMKLILPNKSSIEIEHKERVNNKNISGPTKAEWEKSPDSIFIISSSRGKVVSMSYEVYIELISSLFPQLAEDKI
jgi:hypothetical protein